MSKEKLGTDISFENLTSKLKKVNPRADLINKSEFAKITEWISTGNYMLNAIISGSIFKGIPAGRITCIAGESGTGKSFLALNAAREAQKTGHFIYYFDTENAIAGPEYNEEGEMIDAGDPGRLGVDMSKFVHVPIGTIEELTHQVAVLTDDCIKAKRAGKSYPKVMIIVDSMGALATNKLKSDAMEGKDSVDMTKAKKIHGFFACFTNDFGELKWPMLFTNHLTQNIGMFAGSSQKGGSGVTFMPSNIIFLSKSQDKEGDVKVGINVKARSAKNRFIQPGETAFKIRFDTGMNPFVGLEKYTNWKNCGVELGSYIEEIKKIPQLDENGNQLVKRNKPVFIDEATGIFNFVPDSKSKTVACKHLGRALPIKSYFTSTVYSQDVLEQLDKVIQEDLKYSNNLNINEELLDSELGLNLEEELDINNVNE